MAQNSLYPGFAKIKYTSVLGDHFKILPLNGFSSATPGEDPILTKHRIDDPEPFSVLIDAYVAIIKQFWAAAMNIVYAEAWSIASVEADPIFVYSHSIGVLGTAATANVSMQQVVMTYRTSAGGLFKEYFMDASGGFVVNTKDPYPYPSGGPLDDIAVYLTSVQGSWVVGRDGGFIVSPINTTTKTNDALRKDRVLNQ